MPCILAGPGVPQGRQVDTPIYSWDLYPTLCALSGVGAPDGLDARSLVPLLADPEHAHRKTIFSMYMDNQQMVTDGRWKLIRCQTEGILHLQLFDLSEDPWEMTNLANDPSADGPRRRLTEVLDHVGRNQ